ncbi:MAG TPA: peptidase S8 [Peptococcaceae bacterium]|nr:peptidase S8 [Peptococcaceae bacterium]
MALLPSVFALIAGGLSLSLNAKRKEERKIVIFRKGTSLDQGRRTVSSYGGRILKDFPFINALLASFPVEANKLQALARDPQVEAVEDDFEVETCGFPCPVTSDPVTANQQTVPWGVERIGAPAAWQKTTGAGVKVAVLDTGVDSNHPDLRNNVKGKINIRFPGLPAGDGYGHGTHVAGIIAAANNDFGIVGVAPEVEIYAVKVMNRFGRGQISDIVNGLEWALNNQMQIVNMSLGTSQASTALKKAVDACLEAGMLLVAAAGNRGPEGEVLYPARYPGVISVTATTEEDTLADFSSRGPEVTITAPGNEILSTYPGGGYRTMSGTSMAAPHVSGVLALILGSNSNLSAEQAVRLLLLHARKLPGLSLVEQGAGLVDAGWLG